MDDGANDDADDDADQDHQTLFITARRPSRTPTRNAPTWFIHTATTYLYVAAHDRRPAPRVSVPRESESESQAAQMGNGADNLTPILLEPGQSKAVLSVHCRRLVDQSLFASFATVHVISDHPDAA